MTTPRWLLVPFVAAALALASCTTSGSGTATLSQGLLGSSAGAAWGDVGSMGEGRPEFPETRDQFSLTQEWDSQSRAFENSITGIGNYRGDNHFTPTMNGCDGTDYLIRWRTVAAGVTVTAYSVDSVGNTHGEVTGENGWLRLDGCHVVGFEFNSSDRGGNLADVTTTVQAWRPTA